MKKEVKKPAKRYYRIIQISFILVLIVGLVSLAQYFIYSSSLNHIRHQADKIQSELQQLIEALNEAQNFSDKHEQILSLLDEIKDYNVSVEKLQDEYTNWKDSKNWSLIKSGMGIDEVETIIGEPSKKKTRGSEVVSYYAGDLEGVGTVLGEIIYLEGKVKKVNNPHTIRRKTKKSNSPPLTPPRKKKAIIRKEEN